MPDSLQPKFMNEATVTKLSDVNCSEATIKKKLKDLCDSDQTTANDWTLFTHALETRNRNAAAMSNVYKKLYDTAMAVINNIR